MTEIGYAVDVDGGIAGTQSRRLEPAENDGARLAIRAAVFTVFIAFLRDLGSGRDSAHTSTSRPHAVATSPTPPSPQPPSPPMTEYDYSPEAFERYTATQARISNWVQETRAATSPPTSRLASPHSASPPPPPLSRHNSSRHKPSSSSHTRTRGVDDPHTHTRSRSNSHASRPNPTRSQTLAAPQP
ncbi:hypothetical protein OF83DRAFT_1177790, partial [Amylostereum chailletii]